WRSECNLKCRSTPALPKHPGHLNDSRCNSSRIEAGVLIVYHQATSRSLPKAVAVFCTDVRGARLVSREPRVPPNLFDVQRSDKPTVNLRHWVGRMGPQNNFMPVAS
ncbi:hypothetical protein AVEN_207304-1, partial [Araneus ventricosus]